MTHVFFFFRFLVYSNKECAHKHCMQPYSWSEEGKTCFIFKVFFISLFIYIYFDLNELPAVGEQKHPDRIATARIIGKSIFLIRWQDSHNPQLWHCSNSINRCRHRHTPSKHIATVKSFRYKYGQWLPTELAVACTAVRVDNRSKERQSNARQFFSTNSKPWQARELILMGKLPSKWIW